MMTWDEMMEIALEGAHGRAWRTGLSNRAQAAVAAPFDRALRALRAAGVAMVPEKATEVMNDAGWSAVARDVHVQGDPGGTVVIQSVIGKCVWRDMVAAGQIKPEGE